ncbi:MAG: hypothetical protein WBL49_12945 [Nitrososphaeraceae archaeon]
MIKTSMVRTMTTAVPLALIGTFIIPTSVMAQIDGSTQSTQITQYLFQYLKHM